MLVVKQPLRVGPRAHLVSTPRRVKVYKSVMAHMPWERLIYPVMLLMQSPATCVIPWPTNNPCLHPPSVCIVPFPATCVIPWPSNNPCLHPPGACNVTLPFQIFEIFHKPSRFRKIFLTMTFLRGHIQFQKCGVHRSKNGKDKNFLSIFLIGIN